MKCKGLTLLELLASLSIAAILLTLAAPGFTSWIERSRLRTQAYDLLTDLQKTRAEAVHRIARVSLWNVDGDWSTGWEMFVDSNSNGNRESSETLLFERQQVSSNTHISGNRLVSSYVSYVSSGASQTINGAFQAGTLTLCGATIDQAYQIVISRGGRARLQGIAASAATCP